MGDLGRRRVHTGKPRASDRLGGFVKCLISDVLIMLFEIFVQAECRSSSPYQCAIELGLVGSFDGPEDLSERVGAYARERLMGKIISNGRAMNDILAGL